MMPLQAFALALMGPFAFVSAATDERTIGTEHPCRLWLAPSHLSSDDTPRFGLYAGAQGFAKDEIIPSYEMSIPLFDFLHSPAASRSDVHRASVDFLESNMWLSDYAGSKFEANHSASVFIPGIGVWANHHSGISNVDWLQASILLRELDEVAQLQRGLAHPSRGSITPYYNATLRATRDIPPGMELYGNFGDNYEGVAEADIYQEKVTRWDFEHADKLLDKILEFMEKYDSEMDDALKEKVLDFMLERILEGSHRKRAKVIRSLIPARTDKLQQVKDAGGTWAYRNRDILKPPDWFENHGLCVDNLRPGPSTIPDAGRGAFSIRSIEKGAVISPVPMLPILNEEILELYAETIPVDKGDGEVTYELDENASPTGNHLLLNYCYGHAESSLLLLPSAPMVNLINHTPERSQVNAYLQWSTHEAVFNDHNLHDEPFDMRNLKEGSPPPPVVMELVALRDIQVRAGIASLLLHLDGKKKVHSTFLYTNHVLRCFFKLFSHLQEGEEILIDYGKGWNDAWIAYKKAWDSGYSENSKWPLKAADVRPNYKDKPFPVNIQDGQVPYPAGVVTACFMDKADDLPDGEPKRNNANGLVIVRWLSPTTRDEFTGQHFNVCDLMSREAVMLADGTLSYNYTIVMQSGDTLLEARQVPHSAITLVDRPYSSDMHVVNPFRQWIEIDDYRFPQAWRNLRE